MKTLICLMAGVAAYAQSPQFTKENKLVRPADYREWIYLSSGLGMTYGGGQVPEGNQLFDNVFVNPPAYREFMKTGKWPEGTIFVLEVRNAESNGSINKGGHFQAAVNHMAAEVKDSKRFKDGWAFFPLSADTNESSELPKSAGCQACHGQHGAVDNTFVQFYPTLLPVAKAKGTLKKTE